MLLCLSCLGVSPRDLVLLPAWAKVSPDSERGKCRALSVLAGRGLGARSGEHVGAAVGCERLPVTLSGGMLARASRP